MALTLVTDVSAEPLTLEEAKAHARVVVTDEDELIASLRTAARQHVETFTHRALAPQTWDLKLDRFPCCIEVPMPPVTSIVSLSYVDTNGITQTLTETTDYTTDLPAGPTAQMARIVPAYSRTWPSTRCVPNAVTVRFICGYTATGVNATPEAIKAAMKLLVSHWYENREAVVVGQAPLEVPITVERLLWPYKAF